MYSNRFNLKAAPFGSEPDPDFFFLCDRHVEARNRIDQVLWHDETFAAILGEEGIGKTMLLRHLLDDVSGDAPLIHLSAAIEAPVDLLRNLLSVLGFDDIEGERAEYRNILAAYLTHQQRQGSRPVLVLDNVETFSSEVLEELKWLATIGESNRSALHFVLFGREEFSQQLLQNMIRDLGDQIRTRYRMRGLSEGETLAYVSHRLELVGGDPALIPEEAIPAIYRYSHGNPGKINKLCEAVIGMASESPSGSVSLDMVSRAVEKYGFEPLKQEQTGERNRPSIGAFRREQSGKLVITLDGKLCGSVALDCDRVVIGRHTLNNICIDSNAVSRCHAQVINVDGASVLMDLNSTNGTYVNFKRVQQHLLRDNDIVAIGRHRLKFVAGTSTQQNTSAGNDLPTASETVVLEGDEFKRTRPAMKRVK